MERFEKGLPFSVVGPDNKVEKVIVAEKPAGDPPAEVKSPETAAPEKEVEQPETTPAESPSTVEATEPEKKPDETKPVVPEKPAPSFDEVITQRTGGKFKTVDEVIAALSKEPENKYKDDYIKKIVDYYEEKGELRPVLEALSTDWSKVSDEDLFRQDLKERYPGLSQKALEKIYQKEVIAKYNLDEEDNEPDDVELGKELFQHDAKKLRDARIKAQAEFKIPERQDQPAAPDAKAIQAQRDQFIGKIKNEPASQELLNNKRVVVPYEGGEFNFEVENPEQYLDMTADTEKALSAFIKDGKLDLGLFYRSMAYAHNEAKYIQSLKTHFKSIGTSDVIKEIKNQKPPENQANNAPEGVAKDWKTGFLKQVAAKGVTT